MITKEDIRLYLDDVKRAVEVMRKGGVILYPTDTIWGIGCDATNPEAVRKVYAIKQRSDAKALITLIDTDAKLPGLVREVPDVAYDLIDASMPDEEGLGGDPMTIIYDGGKNLAPNLLAEDGSIAIRITCEPFSQLLCQRHGAPVVSTSANISGQPSPRIFADISEELKAMVDYVCTSRREETQPRSSSRIIKLGSGGQISIIR